ncbi:EAL domain-containing protein [Methylobacterium aerolatum]|uniref:Cyclic-di-GMP phosphodiesterase TipF (Flagellum assembly factor) n=1 Tax=Methylobacterium aerolatum TaxID=418708 RepID=A0ABU0I4L5_9HYPH|nr:EAL domain-containing protein [Methylobacterium aerolatum]MDQ0449539.1 cyclic-di-GMP phosphodiesterase TipF (flagellum assembly factor) [Methylobacterium aerolatum]
MKTTMARASGRTAGLWSLSLLGVVTLAPLAVIAPMWSALGTGAMALAVAGIAQFRLSRVGKRCDKLSQEVGILSQRLLALEEAKQAGPAAPATDGLHSDIQELTVEIGLLSGIVRDLSGVVRSQDSEIAGLRAQVVAAEARTAILPAPAPRPPIAAATVARAPLIAPPVEPSPAFADLQAQHEPQPLPPARIPPRPIPPRPASHPVGPGEGAILAAFEAGRVEVYLQPVVSLPQRKVVAYEALARLRIEDLTLEPEHFLPALERHGRTTELDRRMLHRAGTIVRHLGRRGSDARVTYALSPLSLFEPGFLKDIARIAGDDQALAGLEIALPQESWRGLDAGQLGLLAALRGRIGFCLDRPDDLRFDAGELAANSIGQVKVPAALLLRPTTPLSRLSDIAVEDLAPALARARIRFVVTEVGNEADVPDLIDLNIPYAQGTAFAPARPVRGEILSDPSPDEPPPPQDDPTPERRPFRSVLRRAG